MDSFDNKKNLRPEVDVEITSNIDIIKLSICDIGEKEVVIKGGCTKNPVVFKSPMCSGHYGNGISICVDADHDEC